MQIGVVTLFPDMFKSLDFGITGRALEKKLLDLSLWNPRDYSVSKHKHIDDRPFGGGPGMVLQVEPLIKTIHAAKKKLNPSKVIYLSPQGKLIKQAELAKASSEGSLILVAGRYEGIDERTIQLAIDDEWSIGDYIISGGELAAMVIIDAITRLLPGALGDTESAEQDSFSAGLLDYPHYTRPRVFADLTVPEVLLSGDHQAIYRWRLKQSLGRTWLKRRDLLNALSLSDEQKLLLTEFINEYAAAKHEE